MHLTESVFHSILSNKDFYTFFHTRIFPVYLEIYITFPVSIVSRFTKFENPFLYYGDSEIRIERRKKKKKTKFRALLSRANFSLFSLLPFDVAPSPTRGDARVNRVYTRSPTPVYSPRTILCPPKGVDLRISTGAVLLQFSFSADRELFKRGIVEERLENGVKKRGI